MDADNEPIASDHENDDQEEIEEIYPDEISRESSAMIDEAQKDYESFLKTNPEIEDRSLRIIKEILKRIHTAMTKLNGLKSDDK